MQTIDGKLLCLWVGLGLIAFGSGGIKPCVSAFMGDQFQSDQRHLLQKALRPLSIGQSSRLDCLVFRHSVH